MNFSTPAWAPIKKITPQLLSPCTARDADPRPTSLIQHVFHTRTFCILGPQFTGSYESRLLGPQYTGVSKSRQFLVPVLTSRVQSTRDSSNLCSDLKSVSTHCHYYSAAPLKSEKRKSLLFAVFRSEQKLSGWQCRPSQATRLQYPYCKLFRVAEVDLGPCHLNEQVSQATDNRLPLRTMITQNTQY